MSAAAPKVEYLDLGDTSPPLKQYRAVDLSELLAHQFPEREHVLSPVLTLGSLNMLYGWRGLGKTHMSLGIAYAAATGSSFLGWNATRPFKTLLIDGEMPGESLQLRLATIAASADSEPEPGFFRVMTIDLCGGWMPDLATREGQAAVGEECDQAEIIIVDNLSCLCRGKARENDAESWLQVAEWAMSLRSRGKCVVFVHHAGKDGNQRGTSKREDILDVVIGLKRPADYSADQGARFIVNFDKARHLTGKDTTPFEAWLQADERGRNVWTIRETAECTFDQVVELANLGMSQRDIAEELGINKSNVCRHYAKAVAEGLIEQSRAKGGPKPIVVKPRKDTDD
ncbi:AAA family ATPase [Methylococcus sp. ANG]|uniref:AAA family ATPase n=1 Tax=Methylococcus sp. ANG TaxID=3231903 RepID=UPI00345A36A8